MTPTEAAKIAMAVMRERRPMYPPGHDARRAIARRIGRAVQTLESDDESARIALVHDMLVTAELSEARRQEAA